MDAQDTDVISHHDSIVTDDRDRIVKIRLDAMGRRMVGYVRLNPGEYRISDRLNNSDPFFFILSEEADSDMPTELAILKDAMSFVAALKEPKRPESMREEGKFHRVSVELLKPATVVEGELFIPQGASTASVLNDSRRFVNLRNVKFSEAETYDYLALAKNQSRLWRVLEAVSGGRYDDGAHGLRADS